MPTDTMVAIRQAATAGQGMRAALQAFEAAFEAQEQELRSLRTSTRVAEHRASELEQALGAAGQAPQDAYEKGRQDANDAVLAYISSGPLHRASAAAISASIRR